MQNNKKKTKVVKKKKKGEVHLSLFVDDTIV
jgi:hypothetical protein